jgi:hypothetical protein
MITEAPATVTRPDIDNDDDLLNRARGAKNGEQTYGEKTIAEAVRLEGNETKDRTKSRGESGATENWSSGNSAEKRIALGIRTPEELSQRVIEIGSVDSIIDSIIPGKSLGILVGDSGLGKSPLLYQAAVCVAEGVPFLGFSVTRGAVVYFDFENGLAQVQEILKQVTKHLGLTRPPDNFYTWNRNDPDCFPDVLKAIRDFKPKLAIIDSLSAFDPKAEDTNRTANELVGKFRDVMAKTGCSILCVHHLRKPSTETESKRLPLESGDLHTWFTQVRGAGALVNSWDFRIGIDRPKTRAPLGKQEEIALVMGGFERVKGKMPFIHVGRILDEEGEPLGYTRITGANFLTSDQKKALSKLPQDFRFKQAKQEYGKGGQATTDFLQRCMSLGLVSKNAVGTYEKLEQPEEPEDPCGDGQKQGSPEFGAP